MSRNFLKSLTAKVLLGLPALLLTPSVLLAESPQPRISLRIDNYEQSNLVQLFVYPPGSDDRIHEKLQGKIVKPGETVDLAIYNKPGECVYDIKAVFANGQEKVERQLNFCDVDGGSYSLYGADDRVFKVSNRSNNNMLEFYWRKSGQETWGEDLLGTASIGGRQTVIIPINDGKCLYEFRAVFANGQILEMKKNVCENNSGVVSDVIFGGQ
jgi:hypothetical protein